MLKEILKNPGALLFALLIHAVLIALLVVSIDWHSKPVPLQGAEQIVQATVIDEAKLQAEKERKLQEQQRQRDEQEAQRRAEQEKQRLEEQRKRDAEEAARKKQQQEVETQRQTKLKAEQEAKARKLAEEKKRLAEQETKRKLEEQRRAEEARRKAEEQRKADEVRRQRENEELLKQQLAQEEADRAAQAKAEQQRRELAAKMNQYIALLQNLVTRNWIRPPSARAGMSCTVHVRFIPSGEVLDAKVMKSSGDPAFDSSAEKAVLRSSPLPPPPDSSLREFDFVFKPES